MELEQRRGIGLTLDLDEGPTPAIGKTYLKKNTMEMVPVFQTSAYRLTFA
jgi:hypothetical protein